MKMRTRTLLVAALAMLTLAGSSLAREVLAGTMLVEEGVVAVAGAGAPRRVDDFARVELGDTLKLAAGAAATLSVFDSGSMRLEEASSYRVGRDGIYRQLPLGEVRMYQYGRPLNARTRVTDVQALRGSVGAVRPEGAVYMRRAASPRWQPVVGETELYYHDAVRTGPDGSAVIELARRATLLVEEDTVAHLQRDAVVLERGGVLTHWRRRGHRFEVHTPVSIVGVRGTVFRVESDGEAGDRVGVFEGRVQVEGRGDGRGRGLTAGMLARVSHGGALGAVGHRIDPKQARTWGRQLMKDLRGKRDAPVDAEGRAAARRDLLETVRKLDDEEDPLPRTRRRQQAAAPARSSGTPGARNISFEADPRRRPGDRSAPGKPGAVRGAPVVPPGRPDPRSKGAPSKGVRDGPTVIGGGDDPVRPATPADREGPVVIGSERKAAAEAAASAARAGLGTASKAAGDAASAAGAAGSAARAAGSAAGQVLGALSGGRRQRGGWGRRPRRRRGRRRRPQDQVTVRTASGGTQVQPQAVPAAAGAAATAPGDWVVSVSPENQVHGDAARLPPRAFQAAQRGGPAAAWPAPGPGASDPGPEGTAAARGAASVPPPAAAPPTPARRAPPGRPASSFAARRRPPGAPAMEGSRFAPRDAGNLGTPRIPVSVSTSTARRPPVPAARPGSTAPRPPAPAPPPVTVTTRTAPTNVAPPRPPTLAPATPTRTAPRPSTTTRKEVASDPLGGPASGADLARLFQL